MMFAALTFVSLASAVAGSSAALSLNLAPRAPSSGCGKTHIPGFHDVSEETTFVSGMYNRSYAVEVPPNYNAGASTPWPLILDYHGRYGNPEKQRNNSRYFNHTKGHDFLVVYPEGLDQAWDGPDYALPLKHDLEFTTDLLARLRERYCIDDERIYASGKSVGGGFVDTLACSNAGDEFAAFAMAAAALYNDMSKGDCHKKRAILEAHGDQDHTAPYSGDPTRKNGALPSIESWVAWWGERCDPDAKPQYSGDLGGYNITSIACMGQANVTQHYRVTDLGHCWPSSSGLNYDATSKHDECGVRKARVLDYTPVVLDFFGRWTKTNAPDN